MFLYGKIRFLYQHLLRLLCNAVIQPHFDYACSTWFLNLTKSLKSNNTHTKNYKYSTINVYFFVWI